MHPSKKPFLERNKNKKTTSGEVTSKISNLSKSSGAIKKSNPTTTFKPFHSSKDITLVKTKKSTDDLLRANVSEILPRRINFVKSKSVVSTNKIDEAQYNELKSNLIQLNGVYDPQSQSSKNKEESSKGENSTFLRERYAMSSKSKVKIIGENGEWLWWWPKNKTINVGAGLVNTGVTCFMNSTLQALTYTPPLASFLLSEESTKYHRPCEMGHFCGFCMIRNHVKTALTTDKRCFLPKNVLINLKNICKMFRRGSEEDAHECLRFILERMHEACLGKKHNSDSPKKKITIDQEMETFIYRTFGFKTVSCVHCTSCGHNSLTYDPALDISLDVKGIESISDSFQRFYKADVLKGDNKYLCDGCKKRVIAKKFSRICTAPRILTIHLKRFSFSMFGPTKYQKFVEFKPRFSLEINGLNYVYDLYGVLVHSGVASMGHYFSFMKSPSGKWYLFDDESVRSVNLSTVLKQNAYILFYAQSPSSMATPSPLPSIPAVRLPDDDIDIYSTEKPKKVKHEVIDLEKENVNKDAKRLNVTRESEIKHKAEESTKRKTEEIECIEIDDKENDETDNVVIDIDDDDEEEEKDGKKTKEEKGTTVAEKGSNRVVITANTLKQQKLIVSKRRKQLVFKEEVLKQTITKKPVEETQSIQPLKKKPKLSTYNEDKLKEDEDTKEEESIREMVVEQQQQQQQPKKSAWKLKDEERELKKALTKKELYSGSRSQFGENVEKWDEEQNEAPDTREKELSKLIPRIHGPSKWDEDYDAPKAQKKKKKVDALGKDHSKTFDELQRSRDASRRDPKRFDKMAPGKRQAKINRREKQDKKQFRKFNNNNKNNNRYHHKGNNGGRRFNNKNKHFNNNKH